MREWIVKTDEFESNIIPHNGNKFLIGNGYLGIRGTMEEHTKKNMCAINLAGIYDKVGDAWRESVNAPNMLYTYICINGEKFALPDNTPAEHSQNLDFYNAIHSRITKWETSKGTVTVKAERFASMYRQHIVALKYSVSADYDCDIEIFTGIDGDIWDINGPHFAKYNVFYENGIKNVTGITYEKGIYVTSLETINCSFESQVDCSDKSVIEYISVKAAKNEEYVIEKIGAVFTSIDENKFDDDISSLSYAQLKTEHIKEWHNIWDISMIEIFGDDDAMYALNYSLYHLNCIAPRNITSMSIPARGLSGQVYKGAVFWDTEMFMIDYFIHTEPKIAQTLINYRIDTIEGARNKASEYGLDGAYYAWESQEGGFEGCSEYNITDVFTKRPMRTYFRDKQYHVSAAVVYGICKYINATGDTEIFENGGAEVIIECARMYRSLLMKKADSTFYEICDVVGPDEYHERVNNNVYTNKMVKLTFETALDTIKTLKLDYTNKYNELDRKYDLSALERKFKDSADNMFIKAPDERGIIEQFDGYFGLEDVTVDEVRSRLLDPKEYWGGAYGVASDTQIIKQADVVAMLGIFNDEYEKEILKRNFEYYEPRTEHGSSLSACMYSLLACRIGYADIAYPLFMKSAEADLRKGGKEWLGLIYIGGTHPASEGGAWIVAVKGFAGVFVKDGKLMKYEAIIFDLDGVIVSTDKCHFNAWKKLADEENIYFDSIINERLRGVSRMESLEIVLERAEKSYTDSQKIEMAERKNKYYKELIKQLNSTAILEGALEFIESIKSKGIKVAIGSSSKNTISILTQLNILNIFDAIADGNDIVNSKPAPDVFLTAAQKLGIKPEKCLVVEDADAGVEAALAAKMDVLAVGFASTNPKATYRASDLKDISITEIKELL